MYIHGFNFKCYGCVCSVCTKRHCTYAVGISVYQYRCRLCVKESGYGRLLECDYFENKHTSSRHYKIKRRKPREDEVLKRLNLIMAKMEIAEPPAEKPEHNYLSDEAKRILKKHGY